VSRPGRRPRPGGRPLDTAAVSSCCGITPRPAKSFRARRGRRRWTCQRFRGVRVDRVVLLTPDHRIGRESRRGARKQPAQNPVRAVQAVPGNYL